LVHDTHADKVHSWWDGCGRQVLPFAQTAIGLGVGGLCGVTPITARAERTWVGAKFSTAGRNLSAAIPATAGVVFGLMMHMMTAPTPDGGQMPMMAMVGQVVGAGSVGVGWLYHVFNSAVIGAVFGWLLGGRARGYASDTDARRNVCMLRHAAVQGAPARA
jgi:hypothetical protein